MGVEDLAPRLAPGALPPLPPGADVVPLSLPPLDPDPRVREEQWILLGGPWTYAEFLQLSRAGEGTP
jgi:hypothetical protein